VTVELPVNVLTAVVEPVQYDVTVVVTRVAPAFCLTVAPPLAAPAAFVTVVLPEEAPATDELVVTIVLDWLVIEELVVEVVDTYEVIVVGKLGLGLPFSSYRLSLALPPHI